MAGKPKMLWSAQLDLATTHGLLGKATLRHLVETDEWSRPILEIVDEHIAYQTKLERDGIMLPPDRWRAKTRRNGSVKVPSCTKRNRSMLHEQSLRPTQCTAAAQELLHSASGC